MKRYMDLITKSTLLVLLMAAQTAHAQIPDPILLWPDGAPGAKGQEEKDIPKIRAYPASDIKRTGAAVVIPVVFGFIWLTSPAAVFLTGAGMAIGSGFLAMLVPRIPEPGRETTLTPVTEPA